MLTPPFLPSSLQSIRVLRLLRLVRLLRTRQVVRRLFTVEGLRYAGLIVLMTIIGGGTAFASVEDGPTAWDGIWWAATTVTTVGYGDVPVTTNGGRIIALIVMVVGIGFGTLVIGAVSERFITPEVDLYDRPTAKSGLSVATGPGSAESPLASRCRHEPDRASYRGSPGAGSAP